MQQLKKKHVAKQGPIWGFVFAMTLTGVLVNKFPDGDENVGVNCNDALDSYNVTIAHSGILPEFVSTAFVILLPLIPLLTPPIDSDNWQLMVNHFIGQTSSFGTSELARHFIVSPEVQFYKKCNLTIKDCLYIENAMSKNIITYCNESNLQVNDLYNSLHGSPDSPYVMIGAALLAFIFGAKHYNRKGRVPIVKVEDTIMHTIKILVLFVCLMIITLVVVDGYLESNHSPTQIFSSIVYGVFLQAIVYGLFKQNTDSANVEPNVVVDLDAIELAPFVSTVDVNNK